MSTNSESRGPTYKILRTFHVDFQSGVRLANSLQDFPSGIFGKSLDSQTTWHYVYFVEHWMKTLAQRSLEGKNANYDIPLDPDFDSIRWMRTRFFVSYMSRNA